MAEKFAKNLGDSTNEDDFVTLHNGNMSAINFSKNFKYYGKTKQIEIKYYFIKNKMKEVLLNYIPTQLMVTNPLTNPFPL